MTIPYRFSSREVGIAIEVIKVLPYLRERDSMDQIQADADCSRIRPHLVELYRELRERERPKIQVRKIPRQQGGRPEWCVIDPVKRPYPMYPPPDWGWHETFLAAHRIATERTPA